MTTLVCWKSVDDAGRETLHFCADSRFRDSSGRQWDSGRKLFFSRRFPDIFGFVGEVLPPQTALGQLIEAIDSLSLGPRSPQPEDRMEAYKAYLDKTVGTYPKSTVVEVLFATRDDSGPFFHVWKIRYGIGKGSGTAHPIGVGGEKSRFIAVFGSGGDDYLERLKEVRSEAQGHTSRAIYWAFMDHLASGADRFTGGPPQMVRLKTAGPAIPVGISHQGGHFIYGFQIDKEHLARTEVTEWHDEKYQFIEPVSGNPRSKAQKIGRR